MKVLPEKSFCISTQPLFWPSNERKNEDTANEYMVNVGKILSVNDVTISEINSIYL